MAAETEDVDFLQPLQPDFVRITPLTTATATRKVPQVHSPITDRAIQKIGIDRESRCAFFGEMDDAR